MVFGLRGGADEFGQLGVRLLRGAGKPLLAKERLERRRRQYLAPAPDAVDQDFRS